MKLEKQSYTYPAKISEEDFTDHCSSCPKFDESKYREIGAKGYCKARKVPIYRTEFYICLDKPKKELKQID